MRAHIFQSKSPIAAALFALVFCWVNDTALARDLLIARSDDPRHVAGTIIDGDEPLRVDKGYSVTLIAQDGRKLRIRGPSQAAPDVGPNVADGSILSTLARLLSQSADRATMAVFRSAPLNRTTKVIALDSEEPRCVSSTSRIQFKMPEGSNADKLSISRASGPTLSVVWPDAQSHIDWPSAMAYLENTQYTVSLPGQPSSSPLRLFTLPRQLPSKAHAVVWMAHSGCTQDAQRELWELIR